MKGGGLSEVSEKSKRAKVGVGVLDTKKERDLKSVSVCLPFLGCV